MILDKIENLSKYKNLLPHFETVEAYIAKTDFSSLEPGKHEIDGANVFLLIQAYDTGKAEEKVWESHLKYIDIQWMLEGIEYMAHEPTENLSIRDPYSDKADVALYHYDTNKHSEVIVRAGEFTVFYPNDGHMPSIQIEQPVAVRKALFKLLID